VFFFSSRRRHTRSYGDWSSDVCSSDLHAGGEAVMADGGSGFGGAGEGLFGVIEELGDGNVEAGGPDLHFEDDLHIFGAFAAEDRSEERRVGKECRGRWWAYE